MPQPNAKQRETVLDMSDWPRSWARAESDRVVGQNIIALFQPFLVSLADQGVAPKTLQRHKNNLYLLGNEVLGRMTQFPEIAPASEAVALDDITSPYEGPWIATASEAEQREFDATCGKLFLYRHPTRQD